MKAFLLLTAATAVMAQQAVVLDLSGSMAGFAASRDKRLQGAFERLGVLLDNSSPVKFYGMSSTASNAPSLPEFSAQEAGARFANPNAFRGGTPLFWTIDQLTKTRKASEVVIFTDAMEEGGQQRMADQLGHLIDEGWSIGLMSVNLPFRGVYYTEQTIPKDFIEEANKNAQAANPQWNVKPAHCGGSGSNCYFFEGERPLLALLMTKSGPLDRLFNSIAEAFSQNRLPALQRTQIAPLQPVRPSISFEAPKSTLAVMKLPDQKSGSQFVCAVPENQAVPIRVIVSPGGKTVEEPTVDQVTTFEIIEKPNWLYNVAPNVEARPAGVGVHEIKLKCAKGGMFSSAQLPGRLKIRYRVERRPISGAWWSNESAANTWAFPFRVYKLEELVLAAHKHAMAAYKPGAILLDQGQQTTN